VYLKKRRELFINPFIADFVLKISGYIDIINYFESKIFYKGDDQ